MKKLLLITFALMLSTVVFAQGDKPFKGYFVNSEYNVYLKIDFYANNILVPGQEIFGEMPGFFGDNEDGRKWLITDAEITGKDIANIALTNDVGSEDLTAILQMPSDSTLVLRQVSGSTLKIARNRKWVKMPKKIEFKRSK